MLRYPCIPASAATKTDIVRDGLTVWYDASNNSNGVQDYEAIEEIALFTDQAGAYAYAGETTEETTEAPTDTLTTEAPTDAPATEAPETENEGEGGCGSVISFGAVAILVAGAAFVALLYLGF